MEPKLIKIDRNGSKHFEGYVTCDRCGGGGGSDHWAYTGWTCYKCGGAGQAHGNRRVFILLRQIEDLDAEIHRIIKER